MSKLKDKIGLLTRPKLKLVRGTRLTSVLFIGVSVLVAAGILWAANMYYDIDAGKVIIEEITQVKAKLLELTGGLKITGGTTEITSGAGAVTIQPTGAVTISPTGAVDITTGATSTWKTSAGALTIQSADILTATSTGAMIFGTAGTERMRILTDGNVGIGTTTPVAILDIYGSSTNPILSVNQTGAGNIIELYSGKNKTSEIASNGAITSWRNVTLTGANLTVQPLSPPPAPSLATTTGGSCATNTTYYYRVTAVNPNGETLGSAEASVNTGVDGQTIKVSWSAVGGATGYKVYRNTASIADGASVTLVDNETKTTTSVSDDCSGDGTADITTQDTTGGASKIYATSSVPALTIEQKGTGPGATVKGKVGIDTTTPAYTLDVTGTLRTTATTTLATAEGYVGIATTTPSYPLTVVGTIWGSGNIILADSNATSTFYGNLLVQQATTLGSATSTPVILVGYLKSDILPYSDSVYNLGSSSYRWANLYAATTTIGTASGNRIIINSDTIKATGPLTVQFDDAGGFILQRDISGDTFLVIDSKGKLTLYSRGEQDLVLDADSGAVRIAAGDTLYVDNVAIGGEGKIIGIVPIFGFDLPVQTATTSYVRVSRTLENYPFPDPATGTDRVHKLVVRYTDKLPTASTSDWRVSTTTGAAYSTFTLSGCNNANLDSGQAVITKVTIPTDGTDWWLEVKSQPSYPDYPIRIFQIFLVAFDVKK